MIVELEIELPTVAVAVAIGGGSSEIKAAADDLEYRRERETGWPQGLH